MREERVREGGGGGAERVRCIRSFRERERESEREPKRVKQRGEERERQ